MSENELVPAWLTLFPPCLQREVPSVVDLVGCVAPWTPPEPSCLSMCAEVSHSRSSRTRRTADLFHWASTPLSPSMPIGPSSRHIRSSFWEQSFAFLLWTGVSNHPPAPLWFLFSFPLSSHLVASQHGPSQSIMRFAVCLIWQLSVGLATEGLAWIFESQRERDCKALWLLPAPILGDRLRRRGITDSYDGPQVVDQSQASAPPDKNCLTPMSFSYFFSPVVPVSSIVHKYNYICRIHNWLSRPHLSGSKWQWMWHRSGTQSGWRWRSAGNSREGRVHGRTASASSPTLPRAARWKTAELSLVLIHSRWVWQTCTRYIHHRPVLLFLVSPCRADQCFLQKVFSPAWSLSAPHRRYSCSREGRGLEKQEHCQFIC